MNSVVSGPSRRKAARLSAFGIAVASLVGIVSIGFLLASLDTSKPQFGIYVFFAVVLIALAIVAVCAVLSGLGRTTVGSNKICWGILPKRVLPFDEIKYVGKIIEYGDGLMVSIVRKDGSSVRIPIGSDELTARFKKMSIQHAPIDIQELIRVPGSSEIGVIRASGSISFDELRQALRLDGARPTAIVAFALVGTVFVLIAFAARWGPLSDSLSALRTTGPIIFMFGLGCLVTSFFTLRGERRLWSVRKDLAEKKSGLFCIRQLEISSEGIHSRTDSEDCFTRWSGFGRFKATGDLAIIYLNQSPLFIVIPKSQFSNDENWRRFLSVVAANLSIDRGRGFLEAASSQNAN